MWYVQCKGDVCGVCVRVMCMYVYSVHVMCAVGLFTII